MVQTLLVQGWHSENQRCRPENGLGGETLFTLFTLSVALGLRLVTVSENLPVTNEVLA